MILFLLGTVFGALLMFMARIANIKETTIVERYKETGKVTESRPVIITPPGEDAQSKMAAFVERLNGE